MKDNLREILERVATGELEPQEAAVELQQLDPEPADRAGGLGSRPGSTATAAARLKVQMNMSDVTVIGDPSVSEAVAKGPHRASREGDTLVVESSHHDGPGFVFGGSSVKFGRHREGREGRRLIIRMNPSLPLEVRCDAGTLQVEGIHAPIRLTSHAGSIRITDFDQPIELDVEASSVRASGLISNGSSRVTCQRSSVRLDLDPASSVKISARSKLGPINLPDGEPLTGILGGRTGTQLGAGGATLEVDAEMSAVTVSVKR